MRTSAALLCSPSVRFERLHTNLLLPLLAALSFTSLANAQDELIIQALRNERQQFLESAAQARARGDHQAALRYAQRAAMIQETPSLQLFLAQEHASLGQTIEGLRFARACEHEAPRAVPVIPRLEQTCRALAILMESRVGFVTLHLPSESLRSLRVHINEELIPTQSLSAPIPVSPGAVRIIASAEGYFLHEHNTNIEAGSRVEHRLELHRILESEILTNASISVPSTTLIQTLPRRRRIARRPSLVAPLVLLGTGIAVGFLAIPFFAVREQLEATCTTIPGMNGLLCPAATASTANLFQTLAYTSIAIGAVTATTGATWLAVLLLQPSTGEFALLPTMLPLPQGAGIQALGSF